MDSQVSQESYDAHRQRLMAASVVTSSVIVSGVSVLYSTTDFLISQTGVGPAAIPYLILIGAPWLAVWLARGPLVNNAEQVALGADVVYTATLATLLLQPTTTLSGAALFFSMKMLATALFFPWEGRSQSFSASVTMAVYWAIIAVSGRDLDSPSRLHQLVGPLIAAFLSVAGGRLVAQARRALFDRGVELEATTYRLRDSLASVRDSEQLLRRQRVEQQIIFDSVPAMIWYKDAENRIVRANRPAAESAGTTPEAIAGRSTYDIYPEDAAKYHEDDLAVMRLGRAQRGIIETIKTQSGEQRWVQTDKVPYRDENGQAIGVIVFAIDITERRLAEEELSRSRRQLEQEVHVSAALAHVGRELIAELDTSVILDRLCKLTVDALACDFSHVVRIDPDTLEYEVVAAMGASALDESLHALRGQQAMLMELLAALDRQDAVQIEVAALEDSLAKALARSFGVTLTLSVALRRGGRIFGILTAGYRRETDRFSQQQRRISIGIAQLASLALQNAHLVEELGRANGVKSQFVATMSHELRTPLNAITGYGSLLIDGAFGDINDEQRSVLGRVLKSSIELLELINATLDLSRLEAGRMVLDVGDVDLRVVCEELRRELDGPDRQGVPLLWQLDSPGTLRSDPVKLKLVLKNVIHNALKFTSKGQVLVAVVSRDDGVEIRVSDTGIGIAPDVMPAIFDAFRQADSTTTRRYDGVGLGLYIVKQLLELLHGSITVESVPDVGSTFRIVLPRYMRVPDAL